jgi:hypothetical protein
MTSTAYNLKRESHLFKLTDYLRYVFNCRDREQSHNALAKRGVDAVQFQVHIAEAESKVHEPLMVKSYSIKSGRLLVTYKVLPGTVVAVINFSAKRAWNYGLHFQNCSRRAA